MTWLDVTGPALAPETALVLAALVLALLDAALWPRRPRRAPAHAALLGLLLALALALRGGHGASAAAPLLAGDRGAALADIVILCGAVLAALLAAGPRSGRDSDEGGAAVAIALGALGAMVAVSARHVLVLVAGLELSALCALAYGGAGGPRAAAAARRGSAPAALAGALALFGSAGLWAAAGTGDLDAVRQALAPGPQPVAAVGAALLAAGLAIRAGAVPFHGWVLDAAARWAPSAALLSLSVVLVPAIVVLGRLAPLLAAALPGLGGALLAAGLLAATAGNLLALAQRRLGRLVACGIVAHVGYALAGLAQPVPGLHDAVWLHLAALLAAAAGALGVLALQGADPGVTATGLARRHPARGVALCLFLVALAGLPPTAAFAARAALFARWAEALAVGPAALLLANACLTAYAFLRGAWRVALAPASPPGEPAASETMAPQNLAVVVLAAAFTLGFGLWPAPLAEAAMGAGGAGPR